ncbi:hypothetical protein M1P56_09885 [Streptomyces sp. HU2014]|uniref:hypothetical protein n=1 Tax=Streptomyces sp. HU2014 TaxID=2939414 RepID=UPI00200E8F0D|nr:hypothetical protein [Streptomyces sp. HU2014]UQI44635.1 hypothetical protein M1P56_09885 [Streptomyces sp. HU2014]
MRAGFRFTLHEPVLRDLASSPVAERLALRAASEVAAIARQEAPKNRQGSWNMYARSISIDTFRSEGTVHAVVQADRHPLLVEYGWRDKTGRRHPGRHVLKGALLKVREA